MHERRKHDELKKKKRKRDECVEGSREIELKINEINVSMMERK